MELLYLYIKRYRELKDLQLNFGGSIRYCYLDGVLKADRVCALPSKFYQLTSDPAGHVTNISAIIGENGTGKTSIASALDEIFSNQKTDKLEYICIYESSAYQNKKSKYCLHNIAEGLRIDSSAEGEIVVNGTQDLPQLVYFSPYYSYRNSVFRTRLDEEPESTSIDISTTKYVNEAIAGTTELYKKTKAQNGQLDAARISLLQLAEVSRMIDFVSKFGEEDLIPRAEGIVLPFPNHVAISVNGDYGASTLHALLVNSEKNPRSDMRDWFVDSVHSFEYACVPDIVLRLISILHGRFVTFYATQREIKGAFPYNDKWVDYGIRVTDLIRKAGTGGNIREVWRGLSFQEQQLIVKSAIDSLVKMFESFAEQMEWHKNVARLLDKLNTTIINENLKVEICTAGDEPDILGEVITFALDASSEDECELIRKILGVFYTSADGRYALDIKFGDFSSGEMAYLSIFSRLYEALKQVDNDNLLIFLDEAETTLHPAWQCQLVYNMIWFVEKFLSRKFVHFVFASHSAMLLSDIPKQNVILLQPKEGGRDRIDRYLGQQDGIGGTFGANVFDLMRIPFGLDSGVMGKWAKTKLNLLLANIANGKKLSGDDIVLAKLFGNKLIEGYLSKWYEAD